MRAKRPDAVILAVLACLAAVCAQAAAGNAALEDDIIVATSPSQSATDVAIYSPTGTLKQRIQTNLDLYYSGGALGISGNSEFAFLGGSNGEESTKGKLAVVRIAGGPPAFLGTFEGGSNLKLDKPSSMASGHVDANGDGYVFAIETASGGCSKSSKRSRATNIIQLRFAPAAEGRDATLYRETSFEAFRSSKCTKENDAIVGMRTIGNLLYVVLEETKGTYVMRSFPAFDPNPTRSEPIVTYANSTLYSVTIDSPQSFIASGVSPAQDPNKQIETVLIRVSQGEEPLVSLDPPGIAKKEFPLFLSGGLTSFVSGNLGVLAPVGPFSEFPGDTSRGCRQKVYRFNSTSLLYDSTLICLKFKDFLLDLQIVPPPRPL